MEAIPDALTPIDDLIGSLADDEVPTVMMFARSVTYGWGAHWGGWYGLLAAMLPELLAQSRAVLGELCHGRPGGGGRPGGTGPGTSTAHHHQLPRVTARGWR
ncbi:MAG: hypothetical protein ACRDTG_20685 [Pseudonocardiaceae bacterium]